MSRSSEIRDGLIQGSFFMLLLFSLWTPLSFLTIWFLPLPFFIVAAKYTWMVALSLAAGCGLFFWVLTGQPLFWWLVIFSWTIGTVMGKLYRRPSSTGTDVVLGGLVAAWMNLLVMLSVAAVFFDGLNQARSLWEEQWAVSQELLESYGFSGELPSPPPLGAVIPGVLILFSFPIPLLNLRMGRWILVRGGFPGKYLPPFHRWRLPRPFFYFYLILLASFLLSGAEEADSSFLLIGNAVSMLYLLFLIQGLAFASFLLHHVGRGKGWMVAVIFSALLLPPVALMIHLLGILDTGTELRTRIANRNR